MLQDALSVVYPHMKLKVFVEDVTAFMEGRKRELPGTAEKVSRAMENEGRREFEAVDHARSKGRGEQGDCVVQPCGREVSGMQQERRSGSCNPR